MDATRIRDNLEAIRARIADAARRAGRDPAGVTLVAVTKRRPPEASRILAKLGIVDQGENYPQELWAKAEALADAPIRWHLIGHLQGNKAKKTLPICTMVHSVDSRKLLETLAGMAREDPGRVNVCLQVNASGEASKHGWSPDGLLADAEAIAAVAGLPVVGLMTIAAADVDPRPAFARLRQLRDSLRERTGLALPELSMGMSGDFEAAVAEGATLVRIGSALFEGEGP